MPKGNAHTSLRPMNMNCESVGQIEDDLKKYIRHTSSYIARNYHHIKLLFISEVSEDS